ncbi:hypothetical protein ACKP2L_02225 [Oenococcus alcoholitolerans]|uniref:hypothetical protein n=1 Tax=Oenococcus alcoholitolerans TaxID=931074 RepID=UPI003F71B3B3
MTHQKTSHGVEYDSFKVGNAIDFYDEYKKSLPKGQLTTFDKFKQGIESLVVNDQSAFKSDGEFIADLVRPNTKLVKISLAGHPDRYFSLDYAKEKGFSV